jgi:hypothetical protein
MQRETDLERLRYPIGRFSARAGLSPLEIRQLIDDLAALPRDLHGRGADVEGSLILLEAVHRRWAFLLRSLELEDFARTFRHPETGVVTLERSLQLYAWHGRHHWAHVTHLQQRGER